MKVVLIGGHLGPALAVAKKLKKDEIFYIGRKFTFEGDSAVSLEYQEINKLNIPFFAITTARFQRKFTRYTIFSLSKYPIGFYQSIKILNKIKPDVVLGFGGYVSIPVIQAAYLLKIPVVIHEQTLEAGFSNRIAAKIAKKVCISWKSSENYFPKQKTILTGIPLREEIIDIKKIQKEKNNIPIIYVTGGSSGSHVINSLVEKSLDKLLKNYVIIHQTGDSQKHKDYEKLEKKISELDKSVSQNYVLKKFFSSMEAARVLYNCDLVVGRAGINTTAELIYLQKPALLIPIPFTQKNEQFKNAEFLKGLGLGLVLEQNLLTEELFISTINSMINNISIYKLEQNVLANDATEKIVEVLKSVSKKKTT